MTKQKRRLGLTVPIQLYERILNESEYRGKTINALCLDIFWEYFDGRHEVNTQVKDEEVI